MRNTFLTALIILSLLIAPLGCGHKAPPKPPAAPPEEAKV